ncbi:MAG TPA: hypothetical protein VGS19_00795 [Streptosporangiaceae bacterium]|nr:hypothetical protein [Streptosporangiaceae bacterium]
MRSATPPFSISTVRAGALFVSALQRSEHPSPEQVRRAIAVAICTFGELGCAEQVAQEFGDHPDAAVARMRWAHQLAGQAFGDRSPDTPAPVCSRPGHPAHPRQAA